MQVQHSTVLSGFPAVKSLPERNIFAVRPFRFIKNGKIFDIYIFIFLSISQSSLNLENFTLFLCYLLYFLCRAVYTKNIIKYGQRRAFDFEGGRR